MNFLIFTDLFRIFLNFSEIILDTFRFFKLEEKFILCADMAADVAGAITCHHVATYVHVCAHVCVCVRECVIVVLSIFFRIYAKPIICALFVCTTVCFNFCHVGLFSFILCAGNVARRGAPDSCT